MGANGKKKQSAGSRTVKGRAAGTGSVRGGVARQGGERESLNLVLAGHVDHGKSTLIGRLFFDTDSLPKGKKEEIERECGSSGKEVEFAFVMDYLQEEREQGITIDTAHTYFKTAKRNYVIIDAPGHKEFLRNMITGASLAEAAILIVDAAEGVQEQTRRHAYVLSLLGMKQVIVALNKMDSVNYDKAKPESLGKEISEFLGRLGITPKFIIPISAKCGDNIAAKSKNMPWFTGPTVLEALDEFECMKKPTEQGLRYAVQDVYKIGEKRIYAGRVESGRIRSGQEIVFMPSGTKTRVKSVEEYLNPAKKEAEAGESTGITTTEPVFAERGEIAGSAESVPHRAKRFRANIFWLAREGIQIPGEVTLKCSTQEGKAAIVSVARKMDSSTLETISENAASIEANEVAEAVIETKKEIAVEKFSDFPTLGRFVLMRGTGTVAGGTVTATE
ncbi:MAG: GTP-binding protein [Candidatus Diapherotrites archaeon]